MSDGATPKHVRGGSIETSHLAVAVDHHDRNLDRIEDAHIHAHRIRGGDIGLRPGDLANRDLGLA